MHLGKRVKCTLGRETERNYAMSPLIRRDGFGRFERGREEFYFVWCVNCNKSDKFEPYHSFCCCGESKVPERYHGIQSCKWKVYTSGIPKDNLILVSCIFCCVSRRAFLSEWHVSHWGIPECEGGNPRFSVRHWWSITLWWEEMSSHYEAVMVKHTVVSCIHALNP